MVKISIIIPLYNQYDKLLRCLDSIRNQTFTDYEVIIVNDGSTDIKHRRLRRDVSRNISTAKCVYQENKGAPNARNKGFDQCNGEYILFCDSDVVMKSQMLEKMCRALDNNPNAAYVYSSFKFGWKTFKLWEFDENKLKKMPHIHTTSLIRREHFPGWDESLKRLQDWDLWLTMGEGGYKGKWIDEVLFKIQTGGTMSNWLPSFVVKMGIGKKAKQYKQALEIIKQKHDFNI